MKCKMFLCKIMQEILEPIRERRHYWEQHIPEVYDILRKGTEAARQQGQQTIAEVREAMRINYLDDKALQQAQVEKYGER